MSRVAFWLLASLSLAPLSFAQHRPRIIMITHGQATDPFWSVVRSGAEAAATETESDLKYESPDRFDLAAMSQLILKAAASHPDGLVVSIPDVAAVGKSIQTAVKAKIPVISINTGLEFSDKLGCLMHVGQEEEFAGRETGQRMKDVGVKNAIILNQEVGNAALDLRTVGFKDGFEGPFHQVRVVPVKMSFKECHDRVLEYLQSDSHVDGIVALGPVAAEPALQAVDELKKTGAIKLCTFDISPAVLEALRNRKILFAVDQQQWLQGYLPVIFLANLAKYGSILRNSLIRTGPNFVTPENVEKAAKLQTNAQQ
ncbi:MAG: sugar ABC transporter substrate-binding protein [Verrucomicrobia bacterium]|nr:sugar ABC transporter substrate-binding protein [Verrucomicrobiota bacterium]